MATGCQTATHAEHEPIIDIHQHLHYHDRPDEIVFAHQRAMGVTRTILLPAGRTVTTLSTNNGESNGLEAKCAGNEDCYLLARANRKELYFGANEVPDVPDAVKEIEAYLKLGAVVIGEQKFRVECDSPQMRKIYQLAAHYHVPVLMHWQYQRYNLGFDRFYKMLEKYPRTMFVGHAQTWWANIDRNYKDDAKNLYPKGKVTSGGLTDSYLRDYPNMFGDLSAGSGLNALRRDEDHAREFLHRHQDKLIYGAIAMIISVTEINARAPKRSRSFANSCRMPGCGANCFGPTQAEYSGSELRAKRNSTGKKQSSGRSDVRAQGMGIEDNDRCLFWENGFLLMGFPLPFTASPVRCH
jgi:hypothetical protein